jgi:hypothetical protein
VYPVKDIICKFFSWLAKLDIFHGNEIFVQNISSTKGAVANKIQEGISSVFQPPV